MKKKMFIYHLREIRTPLHNSKVNDLNKIKNRADLNQYAAVEDLKNEEINEIQSQIWITNEDEQGKINHINETMDKIQD